VAGVKAGGQQYHFVTEWWFDVAPDRLWQQVVDVASWPDWWGDISEARLQDSETTLCRGSVIRGAVKGALPYTLNLTIEVTAMEPPRLLEVRADGDLTGTGRWVLEPRTGGTFTRLDWNVATTGLLLSLLGRLPPVRALLERNHHELMARGYEMLRRRVEGASI